METHALNRSIDRGQRVFTIGHSFHFWVSDLLVDLTRAAGIEDHRAMGISYLGSSRAIQHWDLPEEENEGKKALRSGKVDILTLSCMTPPDEGVRNFTQLAVEHNPNVRVTLQEIWLPEDTYPFDGLNSVRNSLDEFNGSTMEYLKAAHEAYFKVAEDYTDKLNAELGQQTVFIVPDAQAVLALRERIIAGAAPGLKKQSDLFVDAWGHPTPTLKLLSAYCHFAVIYRRSPVGLPLPRDPENNPSGGVELNRILQELAWDAASQHPLSGVSADITIE